MIIADTSLLIVLGRLQRLDILENLFGSVAIPPAVYLEAVLQTQFQSQADAIKSAINNESLQIVEPTLEHEFVRRLGAGEKEVMNLALEYAASAVIIDDKKARNEAKELGLKLFYTTDILKAAEKRELLSFYSDVLSELAKMKIFLPE